MKKHLLTTTALVAAGVMAFSGAALAADKKGPSLKISGGFEQGVGYQDADGAAGTVVQQEDGEIHFTASMKLDNGITVSGKAELETDAENYLGVTAGSENSQWIDESFISVSGTFGMIRLGATDGAMYEMSYGYMGHVGSAAGHLNLEFDSGLAGKTLNNPVRGVERPGLAFGRGLPRLSNDAEAVLYFTPRISGLQAGISYVAAAGKLTDIVSTAVNYNGKFGDAGIGAVVGYATGNSETADDTVRMTAGLKVTVGGFTGAAGVVRDNNGNNMDNEVFTRADAGLRYTFGPNAVRIGYIQLSDDKDTDQTGTIATFSRSLGPGVSWSLDALMTENDNNDMSGSYVGTSVAIKF